ncbi:DUF6461 domain-containing protein [Sphaerisporangium sp. NPDC049003]|uniref:DUF6461 domain-containing protein n=1 Tax=Sphaerisporangium sp. NPDC049003 TaxID=3364517 RepID=UPI00371516B7
MTALSKQDIAWLADDYEVDDTWCLTFIEGVDEHEALARFGVPAASVRSMTFAELMRDGLFPDTVLAARIGDWAVLLEVHGEECLGAIEELSAGTRAVSVVRNDNASEAFAYARDGSVVTGFDPDASSSSRWGSDPDHLLPLMEQAGFPVGPGDSAAERGEPLLLAASITGVMLTREILERPLPAGARPW